MIQYLKEFRALKISLSLKFVIGIAVVLTAAMGISLYFIDKNHEKLVIEQVNQQAKALFRQIVLTRRWIADHGGVFIEKVPWKDPSPYLSEAEIIDAEGRTYIRQSPAMVTKELSTYAREKGLYWFHITSLKLVNPENAPDAFEKEALVKFATGESREFSMIDHMEGTIVYRYIAPLYIEDSCLRCHSDQGYKTGDVRGAISVTLPMESAYAMIRAGRKGLIVASTGTIGVLMIVLYIMMKELVLRPVNQLKSSMENFSKGKHSQTTSIRTGDELEELGKSFVNMSQTLSDYHSDLRDKISRATKDLEHANAMLVQLNEKKSDFIAQISHELRTPMTSIKGAMEYISARIAKDRNSSRDLLEFLDVIKKNADRLIRMVNDTLDLEHIESGVFELHISQVSLLSLIKDVLVSFHTLSSERDITFQITGSPATLVRADEDRMRQVLINLVSNALNFSPDHAEIQISVTETAESVTVTIRDEGPGIPAAVRKRIFDKFYTIGKRYGTGLGLAICKGIIEAHRGEIHVLEGVKKGSALSFTLPKNSRVT